MAVQRSTHPSADLLKAFGLGKLDDSSSGVVMDHLDQCEDCRKQVAALSGDDFLERLRQARSPSSTPAPAKSLADVAHTKKTPASSEPSWPTKGGGIPAEVVYAEKLPAGPTTISNVPPELANHPQYEILRELGRGGMGVVYLAKNKAMDRLEVLKLINKALLDHPGAVERFLREIRAAAKLSHANVVTAYSVPQMGEVLAFAMEYVEGQNLASLVKSQGPLPVPHACFYVQQAAWGLQHAFEKKMVHRDIKPQNLILAREGEKHLVKVLDFGLAKVMRENPEDTGLTGEGRMLGTPDYVAPEQALDAAKADIRADIYSLGCTLYYLLSGRPPFSGTSLSAVLIAHQMQEAKPLNLMRPEVPQELAAVVRKMMVKSPDQRYQTPQDVVEALSPFIEPGAAPKWKKSLIGSGIGVTVLLLALLGTWAVSVFLKTKDGTVIVEVNEPNAEVFVDGARVTVTWHNDGKKAEISVKSGTRTVEVKKDGFTVYGEEVEIEDGKRRLLTVRLVHQPKPSQLDRPNLATPLPAEKGGEQAPSTVHETNASDYDLTGGRRFVHFGKERTRVVLRFSDFKKKLFFARVYDLATGRVLSPPLMHDHAVQCAWFSPDGKRVVTGGGALTVGAGRVWDMETGQSLTPSLMHNAAVHQASFSQNGEKVLTASSDSTARVWDANTGKPLTPSLKHEKGVTYASFSPDGERVATACRDSTARVWDARTGNPLTPPLKHDGLVSKAVFSPDGKRVATASWNKTAMVWDAANGQPLTPSLQHDVSAVLHVSFSPDGNRVVTASGALPRDGSGDITARVWDSRTGQLLAPPLKHDKNVVHASFSPDGKRIVTASTDRTARVWDAETGQPLTLPLQHDVIVHLAVFSPDGKRVVTASNNYGTARLWDAATGKELKKVTITPD